MDREGRLHVRLSDRLWSELQSILPECSVAIDDVEDHVKKGEMAMTESVGTGWFEKYVCKLRTNGARLNIISFPASI